MWASGCSSTQHLLSHAWIFGFDRQHFINSGTHLQSQLLGSKGKGLDVGGCHRPVLMETLSHKEKRKENILFATDLDSLALKHPFGCSVLKMRYVVSIKCIQDFT